MHAVVVRRIEDGPLGYGWSHNFETRLEKVDNNHLLLKTFNIWMVFTKDTGTSKEIYSTPSSPDDKLTRQPDGTWQWERTGADGSPVNGTLTFDAQGRLTGFQDRLGNATKLDYDAQGRLASVTDSAGRTTRLAYDGNHIAKVTDAAGASWTLSYQSGNLVQIINPLGYRASFEYDNAHRVVRRTDMRGNVTQYAYDQEGGVTLVTDAAGNTVSYETVDNTEPMLSENPSKTPPILGTTTIIYRTPDGNETSRYLNTFNDMGEVVRKEQSSDGGKTNTTWQYEWGTDRPGELVAITDPKGNKTTLSYSGDTGLLRQVKLPGRDTVDLTHTRSAKSGFRTASFERGSDAKIEVRYDELGRPRNVQPVSYTHLTLPTIYSV